MTFRLLKEDHPFEVRLVARWPFLGRVLGRAVVLRNGPIEIAVRRSGVISEIQLRQGGKKLAGVEGELNTRSVFPGDRVHFPDGVRIEEF